MATGREILDRAKLHFRERMSADMQSIEVPEWTVPGEETLTIYWRPMTLAEKGRIHKYSAVNDLRMIAEAVIVMAKNEQGERLWGDAEFDDFMNLVDPQVLARIANAMSGSESQEDSEDIEGN